MGAKTSRFEMVLPPMLSGWFRMAAKVSRVEEEVVGMAGFGVTALVAGFRSKVTGFGVRGSENPQFVFILGTIGTFFYSEFRAKVCLDITKYLLVPYSRNHVKKNKEIMLPFASVAQ